MKSDILGKEGQYWDLLYILVKILNIYQYNRLHYKYNLIQQLRTNKVPTKIIVGSSTDMRQGIYMLNHSPFTTTRLYGCYTKYYYTTSSYYHHRMAVDNFNMHAKVLNIISSITKCFNFSYIIIHSTKLLKLSSLLLY